MQKDQTHPVTVALITGAARRIGAEIARTLHADGMNVVLHYHTSAKEAQHLCASLNQVRAASAITVCADLAKMADLEMLSVKAGQAFGRLDVLVNNASRFYQTALGSVTESAWEDLLNSNLKAPFFLSQYLAPYLAAHQGCIINIADIHGERPMHDYAAYCISKAGLLMMTKSLAKELGPDIRVNAVSPGAMIWPEGGNVLSEAAKQNILERTALKRLGDPIEIAKAVLYFARSANYVTGQVLAVDGGRLLRI